MTILRIKIAVLLLLCSLAGARAQVRPDQFPLQTNIEGTNFEIYSQYNGVNTKTLPIYMKEYFVPNVDSAWQAFTFTDSIGIADSLRMMFIKDNRGRVFYVDADGDALLLRDTAQAVGNVYVLATTADTTTVSSPVEGDIAYVQDTSRLLVYETYWIVFSGGGSGSATFERFEILGDTLYAALTGDAVPDLFVVLSSYLDNTDAQTLTFDTATAQLSITGGNTVSLDGLFAKGSGNAGTIPMWVAWDSLGNSAITQSGQEIAMGLTGSITVPSGTDAEVPVWGAGKLRYNTTAAGFQGGSNGYYLPWAASDNWAVNAIPYSDGSKLTTDVADLLYFSDQLSTQYLKVGDNLTSAGGAVLYVEGTRSDYTVYIDGEGTSSFTSSLFVNTDDVDSWPVFIRAPENSLRPNIILGETNTSDRTSQKQALRIGGIAGTNNTGNFFVGVNGGRSISWDYSRSLGPSAEPAYDFEAGRIVPICLANVYGDMETGMRIYATIGNSLTYVAQWDSAGVIMPLYAGGGLSGTHNVSASFNSDGRLVSVPEQWGTISTSTDASGDITVAHGMGLTPTSVQVTVTGTTPYIVTVHSIDATNFTVRFFDTSGAAVVSTAVTATWHGKT